MPDWVWHDAEIPAPRLEAKEDSCNSAATDKTSGEYGRCSVTEQELSSGTDFEELGQLSVSAKPSLRQYLSPCYVLQQSMKTEKQRKKDTAFPQRKYAIKA